MRYYIDGYNLLFRVANAGENLQEPRQRIIQDLGKKITVLNIQATLVFDSQYEQSPRSFKQLKNFEVHFTEHGETADEYILEGLERAAAPNQTTVVTSDKKLACQARCLLAKTESVEEFVRWLNKRYQNRLKKQKRPPLPIKFISEKKEFVQSSSVPSDPLPEASPEECYQYYLEQFMSMDQAIQSLEKPKKTLLLPSKAKKRKKPKKHEGAASVYDLWMAAFERDLEEDLRDPWKD